jgi:hypothetical protein
MASFTTRLARGHHDFGYKQGCRCEGCSGLALLTTRRFRDVLELQRQERRNIWDLYIRKVEPLVPRHLRFEVPERTDVVMIGSDGSVEVTKGLSTSRDQSIGAVPNPLDRPRYYRQPKRFRVSFLELFERRLPRQLHPRPSTPSFPLAQFPRSTLASRESPGAACASDSSH